MDKEFNELLSQAIKLQMLKELVDSNLDQFVKGSDDLTELITKWESAWGVVFGEDMHEMNYILATSKDAMKAAYVMGMLESVEKVINIQHDIFKEFKQDYDN